MTGRRVVRARVTVGLIALAALAVIGIGLAWVALDIARTATP